MEATDSLAPKRPASALGDFKVAATWGVLAALSVAAVMPYLAQLMPGRFAQLPIPFWLLVALQSMQALVLLGLFGWLGLRMGHRVDLESPLLQAWLITRRRPDWSHMRPWHTALLGSAVGLALVGLSILVDPMLPPMLHPPAETNTRVSALHGLLASFYGGIGEELQMRLFLMTLLVWLIARLRQIHPSAASYWAASALAALLFGAGHLPAAAHIWGLDASVIARTLLLNSTAGIVFGWMYWKRGLEMAMLGHFCADLVLHVAAPLLSHGLAP